MKNKPAGPLMIEVAKQAAQEAGRILLDHFGKIQDEEVESKSQKNYVTYVDRLAEEKIKKIILKQFPAHSILAEESGMEGKSEYQWIIDPLDGTTNFIQGFPMFSVSIAVQKNEELILGVIYDPLRKELFSVEKGKGAFANGERLSVSTKTELGDALLATGFPYREFDRFEQYLKTFAIFSKQARGVRRAGSAAIDLAYTACGRFDGFWELGLSPWDVAAGALLIREAGGNITSITGGDDFLKSGDILAGSPVIHSKMLTPCREIFRDSSVRAVF